MEKSLKKVFRVPRKTNKQILELITDDGDQKQFLLTKLLESFKKPEISKHNMCFPKCWSIKNPEIEATYSKRRQSIKLRNQNTMEYYGFIYLKNEKDLKEFATLGKLRIGNIPDSKLGCGNLGVSLSQFSDIFHPGFSNSNLPIQGILLIVKYLRGKVNYVAYDEKPMEPQPQYDCHIVRNGNNLDANATVNRAFHSTQVFIYEYTEDCDIVEYPSQLLIIGAASFKWSKKYIYKNVSDKSSLILPKVIPKRTLPESFTDDDPIPRKISCRSLFSKLSKPNIRNDPIPMMSGNLIVMDDSSELKINVTLMSRFVEPIPLHNLLATAWELTEVIPNHIFIEFFHYMDEKACPSIIKISQHRVTQLPPKFYDGKAVPKEGRSKHLVCLSMAPSCLADRKDVTKLIDHMSKSETCGRITTHFVPNVLFFLFPSGKVADSLGIPKDDNSSLHVLLLYSIHPEIGCSNILYRDEYTFTALTNTYYDKPAYQLIKLSTLKDTASKQVTQMKELCGKLLRNVRSNNSNSDTPISDTDLASPQRLLSGKTPQKAQQNSKKLPEIPLRTLTTLPETITFQSLSANRKRLPNVASESPESHHITSTISGNPPLGSKHLVINGAITDPESPHSHCHNPQPPSCSQSRNQSQDHKHSANHSVSIQLPLPTELPVISLVPSTNHRQSTSTEPHGNFKLITLARFNNFIQRRGPRARAEPIRNLELMPGVSYASIYKG